MGPTVTTLIHRIFPISLVSTTSKRPYLIPTYLIPIPTIKMRYTIATFALAATAAAVPQYGYQAEESSSAPAYVASSSVPAYAASSSVPAYVASSSAPAYAASTPVYSASSVGYPVASSSAKEYPVTTTKVINETTIACPTPTTVVYEHSTYVVSSSTVL